MLDIVANRIPLPVLYAVVDKLNSLVDRLDRLEMFCRRHEWRRKYHGGFIAYVKYQMENPDHE